MIRREFIIRFVSLIFIVTFLIQQSGKYLIMADYYIGTSKYAKNCINKSRPKMHCNGKCQMMKKIQEEENREKNDAEKRRDNKNESSSPIISYLSNTAVVFFEMSDDNIWHGTNKPVDHSYGFFHPPQG